MFKVIPCHHPDNQSLIWFEGHQDDIDKINSFIRYKNGCPVIEPITMDGKEWWHESTIDRAGGFRKILEITGLKLEAA